MNKSHIADISLLLVAFIWGATFVVVQHAISFLEPLSFNAVRFFLAFILLTLWLLLFHRNQFKKIDGRIIGSGLLIGLLLFLGYAFQTVGLLYTSTSKAGFITGLNVVLVPLFSITLLKLQPSRNNLIGVAIATIGLYFLTMTDKVPLTIGDGYVFLCAIAFALHIIITGKFSSQYPTLLLTVIQLGTVAILSFLSALFLEDWKLMFDQTVMMNLSVINALFITAFFATALAFVAQTNFQKYTSATRVALIFATEPVFAAITAFWWNNERLSLSALLGCALIFTGMIFSELPKKQYKMLNKAKKAS